jgi:hypothetical protein
MNASFNSGLAVSGMARKSIYFFGVGDGKQEINRFDIETNLTQKLKSTMPYSDTNLYKAAGVSINGTIYIFHGKKKYIAAFDMKSETWKDLGVLDFEDDRVDSTSAIVDASNRRVWLFGASFYSSNRKPVLIFNLETGLVSKPKQKISMPMLVETATAVSAGQYGYIMGGFGPYLDASEVFGILR